MPECAIDVCIVVREEILKINFFPGEGKVRNLMISQWENWKGFEKSKKSGGI